jgi:hypothetical protein
LKILALNRVRPLDFEGINQDNIYKYLNIAIYTHQLKHQKAETEKCAKKHIMVFLVARYRGLHQSTTKNAQAAENAWTTAHSAYTSLKRRKVKRGQSLKIPTTVSFSAQAAKNSALSAPSNSLPKKKPES